MAPPVHPPTSSTPTPPRRVRLQPSRPQRGPSGGPVARMRRAGHDHARHVPTEHGARRRRFTLDETTSGVILLVAAVLALAWANSPWRETYQDIAGVYLGPESLGLRMSLSHWAADGLLAIFFFVVGLELKQEFVTGSLRDPKRAAVPMIAAFLGMVVPASIYTIVQLAAGSGATNGWAIPTATDIAFAVALLGILGKGLPPGARVFLLTLAVVDDLLAITVIAVFYTESISLLHLLGSFVCIAVFALLVQRRISTPFVLVPLAILAWALMYQSGVHATVAGVLMGMTVPARQRHDEHHQMTHAFVAKVDPISKAVALPVFAFFAAGVTVVGGGGLGQMLGHPVSVGVVLVLVLGKPIGIWGGTWLLTRVTPLRLPGGVDMPDLLGVSMLAGIGFTVSLLIANLSFLPEDPVSNYARLSVIIGSVVSALLAAVVLRLRVRTLVRGNPEHTT